MSTTFFSFLRNLNIYATTDCFKLYILGPKSRFNLSEQIRSCILLLERKWNAKHLDLSLGF